MSDLFTNLGALLPFLLILLFVFVIPFIKRRRLLKRAGLLNRTTSAFKHNFYGSRWQRRIAERMKSHDLLWSYYLPDHTFRAKEIIKAELIHRRHLSVDIEGWLPPATELTAPRAFKAMPSEKYYRRAIYLKHYLFIICFRILLPIAVICMIVNIVESDIFHTPKDLDKADWSTQFAFFHNEVLTNLFFSTYLIFMTAFGGILMMSILFAIMSRRALRILLLRPFGDKGMTQPLKNKIGFK
jgi:hypothetical protein